MRSSLKQLTSSLKNLKNLYNEFDPEIFGNYIDAGVDNFANLSDLWLWFPAASESLGWYKKQRTLHLVDRIEFELYILWMRESQNLSHNIDRLIQFIRLLKLASRKFPKILFEELREKYNRECCD